MAKNINIGEAELEIMKVLWNKSVPLSTAEINAAVADRGWKRTTISTFLGRLTEKGAVICEKKGNSFFYSPLITKGEYRMAQTRNLISSLYEGSVKDLAVSLFNEETLTEEDVRELMAFLSEKED
ncbi:MAG: BlaI/MecI/CopY family transcriptional regulator [Clostridia bacterium]|nr:BlaI/MecI/CopY family transcriptional regulator [Clostridia bacterium]MBR5266116.1 BlaI/MecI/CopY family transcriptional regulator [Clostridia bacterium]